MNSWRRVGWKELTRRTERSPAINEVNRGVQLWCTIETIDEEVREADVQWTHLEVNGDGQRRGDVDEVQIEQLLMWCSVD